MTLNIIKKTLVCVALLGAGARALPTKTPGLRGAAKTSGLKPFDGDSHEVKTWALLHEVEMELSRQDQDVGGEPSVVPVPRHDLRRELWTVRAILQRRTRSGDNTSLHARRERDLLRATLPGPRGRVLPERRV